MRKTTSILIMLLVSVCLSACYFPYPTNINGTKMVAGKTITGYGIAGENLYGFHWTLDGNVLVGYTHSMFFYVPGIDDIGRHNLTVSFYQNGISHSWTWIIYVADPELLSEDTEEIQDE